MIDRVIEFSARNRILVLTLAAAAALLGWRAMLRAPLDALPEMGEKQVIIHSTWDRSPDLIDSQVTYPIVSALLGAPRVRSVRGISDYGASFVYVIFDEDTDLYWARSRTLEYLSNVTPRLPDGVKTSLGPDGTAMGWVFQYVLVDRSGKQSLADLRSYQDWYLDYYLTAVPGVAEVATVGGFVRQYQVNVDPNRLRAYGISVQHVVEALRSGNRDVGGRVIQSGGAELVVRGLGYAQSIEDLQEILLTSAEDGTPVRIKDVSHVSIGSDSRRGVADFNGAGDVVSGIVIMRQGQNAVEVIDRVKAKIRQIQPSLPAGMEIMPVYDRSELILRCVDNLKWTIVEVMCTVAVVIALFLWHVPSAAVPLITIPFAVLCAFLPFQTLGIGSNVMTLGGIALAIGALVDASIVVVEQTHKRLEEWDRLGRKQAPAAVILNAIKEVARPSFFALLIIAVSFLPVLTLEAEEGRLFKPLAYTKSLAMLIAAVLAITVDPALRLLFTRVDPFRSGPSWLRRPANLILVGKIHAQEKHPISGWLIRWYEPVVEWSLRNNRAVLLLALILMASTVPVWRAIGTEFMPRLDEGALLYMPTTAPGISIAESGRLLQVTDRILKQFPEVEHVLGKAGRAETATDPAPLSMFETLVILKPESSWRRAPAWYSSWAPEWAASIFRHITPDRISREELVNQMNDALQLPGLSNAWTMPMRGRIDMLTTGIRTHLGLKITGSSVTEIEKIGSAIAALLPIVTGTRGVYAERVNQGYFADVRWNREALAKYGLSLEDAQSAIQYAIGGENVTTLIQGRERYPVNVRYFQDFRSDLEALGRVLIPTKGGERQIAIADLAQIRMTSGPAMLRNEDGLLTGYVYVDVAARDLGGYVDEAGTLVLERLSLPPGSSISWSGQYESVLRMKRRLADVIPLTLLLILLLLYLNTRSFPKTLIVVLAVPFSAVGAVWLLYLLGYNMSIAVWVGLIALIGVDAETGIFMLLYLDQAFDRAKREGRLNTVKDLRSAIVEGAARRIRPKFMTIAAMFFGLLPIMWSNGAGADVMKRIAAPMLGGIFTSFLLELIVYPVIFQAWKTHTEHIQSSGE